MGVIGRGKSKGEVVVRADSEAVMDRESAIAAGLLVGDCEWCGAAIWSDRSPDFVKYSGWIWHRDCAEQCNEALEVALSHIDRSGVS
jgi:hypothetical protein